MRRFEHPFWRYDGERTREEEMLVAYFEQRGVLKLVVLAYVLRATVIPLLKKKSRAHRGVHILLLNLILHGGRVACSKRIPYISAFSYVHRLRKVDLF